MGNNIALIVGAVLSSSVLTAIITQFGTHLREKAGRKAAAETAEDSELAALKEALMYILYDRIRFLGMTYIRAGEISFEDRRIIHKMHGVYHNRLGGNGDLDDLMECVDELPLKQGG